MKTRKFNGYLFSMSFVLFLCAGTATADESWTCNDITVPALYAKKLKETRVKVKFSLITPTASTHYAVSSLSTKNTKIQGIALGVNDRKLTSITAELAGDPAVSYLINFKSQWQITFSGWGHDGYSSVPTWLTETINLEDCVQTLTIDIDDSKNVGPNTPLNGKKSKCPDCAIL